MLVSRYEQFYVTTLVTFYKKWANNGLFLLIFVLFKQFCTEKPVEGLIRIRTCMAGVEGKHADY